MHTHSHTHTHTLSLSLSCNNTHMHTYRTWMRRGVICFSLSALNPFLVLWIQKKQKKNIIIQSTKSPRRSSVTTAWTNGAVTSCSAFTETLSVWGGWRLHLTSAVFTCMNTTVSQSFLQGAFYCVWVPAPLKNDGCHMWWWVKMKEFDAC